MVSVKVSVVVVVTAVKKKAVDVERAVSVE